MGFRTRFEQSKLSTGAPVRIKLRTPTLLRFLCNFVRLEGDLQFLNVFRRPARARCLLWVYGVFTQPESKPEPLVSARTSAFTIFVRSTRSRRSRHVRFAPIASEPSHRSESTRCAISDPEQVQQRAAATRSPRQRAKGSLSARLGQVLWQS
jgi:hypothetical protein